MFKIHFSHIASGNPCLSFGKAGRYIHLQVDRLCRQRGDLEWCDDPEKADAQIFLGIPLAEQEEYWTPKSRRYAWFTMWESPEVPDEFVGRVNDADVAVFPSSWVSECFLKRGTTVPRFVVPLGVDTTYYTPSEKKQDEPFTFLWIGILPGHIKQLATKDNIGDRKRGWFVRAIFEQLPIKNARLILKGIPYPNGEKNFRYRTAHGNEIWELSQWLKEGDMRNLIQSADVLVWPTWGEGFGMPPLECAACGVPAIMPDYSSLSDFFDPSWCIGLDYKIDRIWKSENMTGAHIAPDELQKAMMAAYQDRGRLLAMSKSARKVAQDWTWHRTGQALGKVIDHLKGL